jgi:hypothetical protein
MEYALLFWPGLLRAFRAENPIFNHIYVPILPESAHMGEISWHGRLYTVSIECEEASFVGFDPFFTEQDYQEQRNHYQNFNTTSNYDITSITFDPERSATVYHYALGNLERRLVYYSATNNGIEYHSRPTLRPSVEWLTSFGIVEEPHLQLTTP